MVFQPFFQHSFLVGAVSDVWKQQTGIFRCGELGAEGGRGDGEDGSDYCVVVEFGVARC